MPANLSAHRLSAADAATEVEAVTRMSDTAGATITEARVLMEAVQREAERVRRMADAEQERRDTALTAIASQTVDRYLDTKRIEAAAIAGARLIREASAVRREFESMTPWLSEFLRAAIERMVGRMDDEDLLSRLVAEGVASMQHSREVVVRGGPVAIERIAAARKAHPDRFAAVASLRVDASLPADAIVVEGEGGVVDASLSTQVDLLCREIEAPG